MRYNTLKVHFMSNRMDWETPDELFYELDKEFGFVYFFPSKLLNNTALFLSKLLNFNLFSSYRSLPIPGERYEFGD